MTEISPTSFNLVIPAGELMACMNIIAVDDKIALEEPLVAPALVTVVTPEIIGLPFQSTVTLVDNDGNVHSIMAL